VTRVVAAEPIFAVADMPRAVAHYKKLGFEISYYDDGYAFAQRKGVNLHLDLTDIPPPGGEAPKAGVPTRGVLGYLTQPTR
jgi:hypothetical protein